MNVRQEDNSKNKERLYLYTDIQIHIYIGMPIFMRVREGYFCGVCSM